MPTYTSPVAVAELQSYLKDISTDPDLLAFYQTILNASTEYVYSWLDRDFTPAAIKADVFFGDETNCHRLHSAAESIVSISIKSPLGIIASGDITQCVLFRSGLLLRLKLGVFECENEYTITYKQPTALTCPETIKQVILEHAAIILNESTRGSGTLGEALSATKDLTLSERFKYLDISDRHKEMLRMYKRYPV